MNGREAARSSEWAQHFSNAFCFCYQSTRPAVAVAAYRMLGGRMPPIPPSLELILRQTLDSNDGIVLLMFCARIHCVARFNISPTLFSSAVYTKHVSLLSSSSRCLQSKLKYRQIFMVLSHRSSPQHTGKANEG